MASNGNRGIPSLPSALIRQPASTRPEPDQADEGELDPVEAATEQGGAPEPKPARRRPARKPPAEGPSKARKLMLPDDIFDRLTLTAFQKRTTVSAIAADILNRNLPRFRVEREG